MSTEEELRVQIAHVTNDYEIVIGEVTQELDRQRRLLDDAIAANKAGRTEIIDEFLRRAENANYKARQAIKRRLEKVGAAS